MGVAAITATISIAIEIHQTYVTPTLGLQAYADIEWASITSRLVRETMMTQASGQQELIVHDIS